MIRSTINWPVLWEDFRKAEPFNHVVIDNFFETDVAHKLSEEFPPYDFNLLNIHENALEDKRTHNRWDSFPPTTYRAFTLLGRENFLFNIRGFVGNPNKNELWLDHGLNGGGWHMHRRGGNNNVHLDYNIHPKLGEQRKLNIIIYMTPDWKPEWGGGLELWSHDEKTKRPLKKIKYVENKFNRACIFDTTQNSWHGLPNKINCPEGVIRKSLAAYYLREAPAGTDQRARALFAPREDQKNDPAVEELIRKRADVNQSHSVYKS